MAVKRGGLGKGLDSLIPDTGKVSEKEKKVKKRLTKKRKECKIIESAKEAGEIIEN